MSGYPLLTKGAGNAVSHKSPDAVSYVVLFRDNGRQTSSADLRLLLLGQSVLDGGVLLTGDVTVPL